MTYEIFIKLSAQQDISDAFSWYEDQINGLGTEYLREVDVALFSISRNPLAYQLIHKHTRRYLLRRFPYAVFYTVEGKQVIVMACFHHKREPVKWKDRG